MCLDNLLSSTQQQYTVKGTILVTGCVCVHVCACTVPEHAGGVNTSPPVPTVGSEECVTLWTDYRQHQS